MEMIKKFIVFTILLVMLSLPAWAKKTNIYITEGTTYINQGEYQKAIDSCNEALKIDPYNRDAWFYQAKAYQGLNNWDKANYCSKQVLNLNGNDIEALLLRGNIFYQGYGDSNTALDYYNSVLNLDPSNIYARDWQNRILNYNSQYNYGNNNVNSGGKRLPDSYTNSNNNYYNNPANWNNNNNPNIYNPANWNNNNNNPNNYNPSIWNILNNNPNIRNPVNGNNNNNNPKGNNH
jgi:tetratricopeptide (TPR) repeat protein